MTKSEFFFFQGIDIAIFVKKKTINQLNISIGKILLTFLINVNH